MATRYLLMRHGDAQWGLVAGYPGWAADFAPLSALGREQVSARIPEIAEWKPTRIVCSPMTRAFESAHIVSESLAAPLEVRFPLHEWIPKLTFDWSGLDEVFELQRDMLSCSGEWPPGEVRAWEPISRVRERALSALRGFGPAERVLVVAHGVLMYSLTGKWDPKNGELAELDGIT